MLPRAALPRYPRLALHVPHRPAPAAPQAPLTLLSFHSLAFVSASLAYKMFCPLSRSTCLTHSISSLGILIGFPTVKCMTTNSVARHSTHLLSPFSWVRSLGWLSWVFCSQVQEAAVNVCARLCSHQKARQGKPRACSGWW